MSNRKLHLLNWFLLLIVTVLLCSFQTTFWYQVVGGIAAPLLWLNILLYVSLYRNRFEAILINYALAVVISPFTSMGLGMLWTVFLLLTFAISFTKNRVFWPGTRYFVAASFLATLGFQVINLSLSHLLEPLPSDFNFYSRTLELVFTPIFAAPIYWLLSTVDRISEREPLPERGGTGL